MIQAELACSSLLVSWAGKVSASSKNVFHRAGKLVATPAAGDALGETRADSESVKPTFSPPPCSAESGQIGVRAICGHHVSLPVGSTAAVVSGADSVPCKKQVGAIPSPGSVTELPPPDTGSNRKEPIGKTPQRRNGRAGRADRRPSVMVDPMVIECPENCRNEIAGGKTSDLQVHKVAADCTTTKQRRDPRANGKQPGPPPPFGGTPNVIPHQQLPFLTCVVGSMPGHHICLLAPVVAPPCLSSACCLAARGLEKTAWRIVVVAAESVEAATVSGRRASLPRSFPLDSGSRLPSNDTTVPTSDLPSTCLD